MHLKRLLESDKEWDDRIFIKKQKQVKPGKERSYTLNHVNYISSTSTRSTETKHTETCGNLDKGKYFA